MTIVNPIFKEAHGILAGRNPIDQSVCVSVPEAHLDLAIKDATGRIAPLWPLRHFVAVNPFLGLVDHDFRDACELVHRVNQGDILMAPAFYAEQLSRGLMSDPDLAQAIQIIDKSGAKSWSPASVRQQLKALCQSESTENRATDVRLETLADFLDASSDSQWANVITEEISKWCAAWCDEGQSAWRMPWRSLPLYHAWKRASRFDRNPEIAGITGFRKVIASLPESPREAIAMILHEIEPDGPHLVDFLHRQLMSIAGWAGWMRYREREASLRGDTCDTITDLLAIRLAYDYALAKERVPADRLSQWRGSWFGEAAELQCHRDRIDLLNVLQLAYELRGQNELAALLAGPQGDAGADLSPPNRSIAQAVFCIDVRSEIFRRALESVTPEVRTRGFAGFFGFPIEYIPLGHHHGAALCPVLLSPQYRIRESVAGADVTELREIQQQRRLRKILSKMWKSFKTSAVSCFSYVEIAGLMFGVKLVTDSLGLTRTVAKPGAAGLDPKVLQRIRPLVTRQRGRLASKTPVVETGIALKQRIDLAANALRGMGLSECFPKIVLLCGHGSTTVNNPYGSGLDCGACGGHSGEANARVAAMVLNDADVRAGLVSRGICIPDDTWFIAGLHDTTTDTVTLFEVEEAPAHAARNLARLKAWLMRAGQLTRMERAAHLGLAERSPEILLDAVQARSGDWSEVRPEWGLVGNHAFIAAPRERTRGVTLDGKAFLHEYDHRLDPDGAILGLIMTAPMVVASWINLQYFASTVDNQRLGSGNKVLHNVVGTFGVLEGNGGDLRVGLPLQSVHDGHHWRHEPRRLTVLIEAPAAAIERVLAQQRDVRQLVDHHWVHVLRIDPDDGRCHRYHHLGHWEPLAAAR
jgi:uncharacterized protein YbcC (UPF0753/DUF2309 family)